MDIEAYPFKHLERELVFEFQSVSDARTIKKIIAYNRINEKILLFNLALLDVSEEGILDDQVVSDNLDMEKVLSTVIATIPLFFAKFPKATIYFQGSTPGRTRLYRIVISKYWCQISDQYEVLGLIQNKSETEPFEPNRPYNGFYLKMKPINHESEQRNP